jgi:hypothetical protein
MKALSLAVALIANGLAVAYAAIPVVHGQGLLPYLLPNPFLVAALWILVAAIVASATGLSHRWYQLGTLVPSVALAAWMFVLGWVYLNPLGTPGVGPTFREYLAEVFATWQAIWLAVPVIALFLLVELGYLATATIHRLRTIKTRSS